jgi:UPF0755 protein
MKTGTILLAGVALALILALTIGALGFLFMMRPAALPETGLLYTVREGAGASAVARDLEEKGALRSALAFTLFARIQGSASSIKSGTYQIERGMGARAILALLVSGRQSLLKVTIPEGYTLKQTAALLETQGIVNAKDFLNAARDPVLIASLGAEGPSLEGYLFPDTYFLPRSFPAPELLTMMVSSFRKKLGEAIPESRSLSPRDLQQKLILASIVEREYRVPAEAPYMASVFYNRLAIGMALQSCATVVYVLTEKLGKPHPDVVYDRDLKIADPYNTYWRRGLPPGPICSPGLTALNAAFRPAASRYLYFRLVDADAGVHHFSASLEEHNQAASFIVKRIGG